MAQGKFPMSGRPTIWTIEGQGPIGLAVDVGRSLFGHFTLLYFSLLILPVCV